MNIPPPTITQSYGPAKFLSQLKGTKTNATPTIAGESGSATPALGGPSQALPGSIDLQAFFAAWGTADEQYDVTKNGVVDGEDLAVFLGSAQPQQPASPQEVLKGWGQNSSQGDVNGDGVVDGVDLALALGNVKPSPEQELAAGVQKAWGTDDAQFDLNKDGTVDGSDLALALGGTSQSPKLPSEGGANELKPDLASAAQQVAEAVMAATDKDKDGTIALSDLAGGSQLLSTQDSTSNPTLDRQQLADRLSQLFAQDSAKQPGTDLKALAAQWTQRLLAPADPRAALAKQAYASVGASQGQAAGLSNRLYQQLAASGFGAAPPSNVGALVDGVAKSPAQRAAVLRGLAQRYPGGLGVSTLA